MERDAKLQNAWHTLPDRDLAAEVLGAWRDSASAAGLPGKRKVDTDRAILRIASMSGSGFAYPGIVSGIPSVYQDDADDMKGDRKTSFGESASSQ